MSIDCIDSVDGIDDFMDDDIKYAFNPTLWNGRDVQIATEKHFSLAKISQFFAKVSEHKTEVKNIQIDKQRYSVIDVAEDDEEDDFFFNSDFKFATFSSQDRTFTFADPSEQQEEIVLARNFIKSIAKKAKKLAKQVAHYVEEHKTEILIAAAIITIAVGGYVIATALGATTAGSGTAAAVSAAGSVGAAATMQIITLVRKIQFIREKIYIRLLQLVRMLTPYEMPYWNNSPKTRRSLL